MHTDLTEKENRWVETDLGIDGRRSGQSNPHQIRTDPCQSVSIRGKQFGRRTEATCRG